MLKIVTTASFLFQIGLAVPFRLLEEPKDTRPVKEAWGDKADIADCFVNSVKVGIQQGGQSRSDISLLINTDKMSYAHRVSAVKVCQPYPINQSPSSLISSI